jgi:hypothetical protein
VHCKRVQEIRCATVRHDLYGHAILAEREGDVFGPPPCADFFRVRWNVDPLRIGKFGPPAARTREHTTPERHETNDARYHFSALELVGEHVLTGQLRPPRRIDAARTRNVRSVVLAPLTTSEQPPPSVVRQALASQLAPRLPYRRLDDATEPERVGRPDDEPRPPPDDRGGKVGSYGHSDGEGDGSGSGTTTSRSGSGIGTSRGTGSSTGSTMYSRVGSPISMAMTIIPGRARDSFIPLG